MFSLYIPDVLHINPDTLDWAVVYHYVFLLEAATSAAVWGFRPQRPSEKMSLQISDH